MSHIGGLEGGASGQMPPGGLGDSRQLMGVGDATGEVKILKASDSELRGSTGKLKPYSIVRSAGSLNNLPNILANGVTPETLRAGGVDMPHVAAINVSDFPEVLDNIPPHHGDMILGVLDACLGSHDDSTDRVPALASRDIEFIAVPAGSEPRTQEMIKAAGRTDIGVLPMPEFRKMLDEYLQDQK